MVDKPAASDLAARADYVRGMLRRSIAVKQKLMADDCETVVRLADLCIEAIANGGKLMFCGNGGSAADAQHLAAEMLVRLRPHVDRDGLPAIALAMDSSAMTACGNDYSYEVFYERMVKALGRKGDVLIAITTSGKSPNIIHALKAARARGIVAIGFLGGNGGPALQECDDALIVPDTETGRIQEGHITMGHALMELIEDGLLERGAISRG